MDLVNKDTGEIVDAEPAAITHVIEMIRKGEFSTEAGAAFAGLMVTCNNLQRTGRFSLTFVIKPDNPMVKIEATFSATPPKSDPTAAMFFPDDFGNLHRSDPNQQTIF